MLFGHACSCVCVCVCVGFLTGFERMFRTTIGKERFRRSCNGIEWYFPARNNIFCKFTIHFRKNDLNFQKSKYTLERNSKEESTWVGLNFLQRIFMLGDRIVCS